MIMVGCTIVVVGVVLRISIAALVEFVFVFKL